MTHDQQETPYLDAAAALSRRRLHAVPHARPQARQGRPGGAASRRSATLLQVDVAMAGGVEDTRESTGLLRPAEALAAEAWGADALLVPGQRIHQRHARPGAHPGRARRHGDRAAQLPQVACLRGAHLLRRHAATTSSRPSTPSGASRSTSRAEHGAAALRGAPRRRAPSSSPRPPTTASAPTCARHRRAGARGRRAVHHRPGLGPAPALLHRLPVDAMTAGADAAVVSTHKLISGLTQIVGAAWRAASASTCARLASMVHMTQSTSPQALMYVEHRRRAGADGHAGRAAVARRRGAGRAGRARADRRACRGLRCLGDEC